MSARTELGQFPAKPCVDGLVKCARCHEMLPISQFYKRREKTSRLGRQSFCKRCSANRMRAAYNRRTPERVAADLIKQRAKLLKTKYGITADEYDQMLSAQGGRCAICGATQGHSRVRSLVVDHDHATGAVRGLLCSPCNRGLGHFNDDPVTIAAALAYMERTP